jgi:RimJ/RimL family protein N-acetyltransferase
MNNEIIPILIDIPMPVETPRLIIRGIQSGDGAEMYVAKKETWDHLKKWMPFTKNETSPEIEERTAREHHAKFILREDLMMIGFDRETGKAAVFTGLHRMDWEGGYFETGFWVRKSFQNKGYATEASNALTRFAFGALSAKKLAICHAGGNEESRRVIERLGFMPRGVLEDDHKLPDGRMTSMHWYARYDTNGLPEIDVRWPS